MNEDDHTPLNNHMNDLHQQNRPKVRIDSFYPSTLQSTQVHSNLSSRHPQNPIPSMVMQNDPMNKQRKMFDRSVKQQHEMQSSKLNKENRSEYPTVEYQSLGSYDLPSKHDKHSHGSSYQLGKSQGKNHGKSVKKQVSKKPTHQRAMTGSNFTKFYQSTSQKHLTSMKSNLSKVISPSQAKRKPSKLKPKHVSKHCSQEYLRISPSSNQFTSRTKPKEYSCISKYASQGSMSKRGVQKESPSHHNPSLSTMKYKEMWVDPNQNNKEFHYLNNFIEESGGGVKKGKSSSMRQGSGYGQNGQKTALAQKMARVLERSTM